MSLLLFSSVVLQHFQLATIGGFRLTVGFVLGFFLIVLVMTRLNTSRLLITWSTLLGLSALAGLFALSFASTLDFVSTLLLCLVTSFFIVAGTESSLPPATVGALMNGSFFALVAIVALSVSQVALGSLGSDALFNVLGPFQYQNQYDPQLAYTQIPRAQGFFLEPSYDAFVIGSLSMALITTGRRTLATLVLAFVGLGACQSATGLILFLLVTMILVLRSRPQVAVPLVGAGCLLLILVGGSLATRLSSIGDVGSSANYRLVAPLRVLTDVLTDHPFGLPLGSIYEVVARYGLVMDGAGETVSLDNGVYVLVYYFGWFGVAFLALLAMWVIGGLVSKGARDHDLNARALVPLWLYGSLLFSGGIVAPEFGLMSWLTITAYVNSKEREFSGHTAASPERDNSDLPRYRGSPSHPRVA